MRQSVNEVGRVVLIMVLALGLTSCATRSTVPLAQSDPGTKAGASPSTSQDQSGAAGEGSAASGIEERERQAREQQTEPSAADAVVSRESFLSDDVPFAYNSFILDDKARRLVEQKARWLTANEQAMAQIEGHCDERGTLAYNLALGERRANAVKQYIVHLGIDAKRLTTISYGEEFPIDPRHNDEAWTRNRRVHFAILN